MALHYYYAFITAYWLQHFLLSWPAHHSSSNFAKLGLNWEKTQDGCEHGRERTERIQKTKKDSNNGEEGHHLYFSNCGKYIARWLIYLLKSQHVMLGGHFAMQGNQTNFSHLARLVSVMELWCFVSLVTWSMINTSLAPANYYLWNYPKLKQGDDKLYIYWGGVEGGDIWQ